MAVGIYAGCKEGCAKCKETCRLVPEALYGAPGYADGCNNDGCYPVTEELKTMMEAKLPEGATVAQDALLYAGDGTEDGWTALDPAATGLEGPIYRVTVTAADASEILLYVQITAK